MFTRSTRYLAYGASALFVIIGFMISYEVLMRYVFLRPTTWSEEISRFLLIWAVYLSAAHLLHNRDLISITVIQDRMSPRLRMASEIFALLWIAAFCLVAIYYGLVTVLESIEVGRKTATMLSVPQWMTEIAIPVGFTLLFIQCFVEARAVMRGERKAEPDQDGMHHE